jgi:hypothetical protein
MIVGVFQPSQQRAILKTVYFGKRCGSFGYYIIHAGMVCPVHEDELMGWYRHCTEEDWRAGVRSHLDPREKQGELF